MSTDQIPATQGPVFVPSDDGYEEEIAGYNRIVTHRPQLVVGAETVEDIATAVQYAGREGLSVGVQATGHGPTVPADGVLITTHRMRDVEVDPQARTARVAAGAQGSDVLAAAASHGLAPLGGSTGATGFIGYLLGGGLPMLGRQFGYAADRVRSIDVVTADGTARTVTPDNGSDLFWALLGARGNFGVVASVEVDLVPVDEVIGGSLAFVGKEADAVIRAYFAWLPSCPDDVSTSIASMQMPDQPFIPEPIRGQRTVQVRFLSTGSPETGFVDALSAAGSPVLGAVGPMRYADVATIHNEPTTPTVFAGRNGLLRELDEAGVEVLVAHLGSAGDDRYLAEVRHLGGALAVDPGGRTCIDRRDGALTLYTGTPLYGIDEDTAVAAQHELHSAIEPWSLGAVNTMFLTGAGRPGELESAFTPEAFQRLRDIKRQYDPSNMFRVNRNITPAAG
ncbi:FAD-binding oxidoreductase [Luteipulveratus mongoliensis]|uniref:FAD-binding oxidoreductase n=1 Tax=Luteipulveratus mongoliensis TaxID=571913 RepID=UPI0014705425|nr:FAD-binding oxidoreductase [Luteipulveratus mongoliensis]